MHEHTAMAHSPFNEQIKSKTASMHAISVLLSLVRIKIEMVHTQVTVFLWVLSTPSFHQ